MATFQSTIPISHVLSNVTMTVSITGLTKWHFQVRIARQLIRLAAFILNINLKIDTKRED